MFFMFFSMFSNVNAEVLVNDGNTSMIKIYILFSIFVMFQVDPNRNICRKVQKNHLPLCTCFIYLCVGHVAPVYILLHYNYLETKKVKRIIETWKQNSRNQSCRKIPKTFCLDCDSKIPYEINNCRNILKLDHTI
jgi:hypothetical protein